MNREEITNSQDYKAQGIALDWWRRNGYDIKDGVVDIIDAYSDGVIYGWNNPNWISVEERLPEENTAPLVRMDLTDKFDEETILYDVVVFDGNGFHAPYKITHWMEIVPPRKEEQNNVE